MNRRTKTNSGTNHKKKVNEPSPSHRHSIHTPPHHHTMSRSSRRSTASPPLPDEGYEEQRVEVPKWVQHWSEEQRAGEKPASSVWGPTSRDLFNVTIRQSLLFLILNPGLCLISFRTCYPTFKIGLAIPVLKDICPLGTTVRISRFPCPITL